MNKLERVIYWAMYFKIIRITAREIIKRQNEFWIGKEGDAPKGILNHKLNF